MAARTVILKGYLIVPDADLPAVLAELPHHIDATRQEEGCLIFEVSRDDDDANRFNVYEEFVDSAAFAVHQSRVSRSPWGEISKNAERHYQVFGLKNA